MDPLSFVFGHFFLVFAFLFVGFVFFLLFPDYISLD